MTDFWDWSVATYAKPGVAEASLRLQDDHGQCVPLLLWAAWAGKITPEQACRAAAVARAWLPVIEPLREVRRRLKTEVSPGDEADRLVLRTRVKAAELDAEHALMARLGELADGAITAEVARLEAVAGVVAAWGEACPDDVLAGWLARL